MCVKKSKRKELSGLRVVDSLAQKKDKKVRPGAAPEGRKGNKTNKKSQKRSKTETVAPTVQKKEKRKPSDCQKQQDQQQQQNKKQPERAKGNKKATPVRGKGATGDKNVKAYQQRHQTERRPNSRTPDSGERSCIDLNQCFVS